MPYRTCAQCFLPLYPKKNGAYLVVMAGSPPRPYQIWSCDIHACKRCGAEIAAGFSDGCHEEHEPDFVAVWEHIKNNPNVVIVYQYERLSDANYYGANPPDIQVGSLGKGDIEVREMTDDDLDKLVADSPY